MGDWYEDLPNEVLNPSEEDRFWHTFSDRLGVAIGLGKKFSTGNLFSGKGRPETPMRPFAGFEVVDFGLGPSPVPTDYYAEPT